MRQVAAFDFDGTLTRRDTLLPFLFRMYGRWRVLGALTVVGPPWRRPEVVIHRRDDVKQRLFQRLFTGEDPNWVAEEGARHADAIAGQLLPDMLERVEDHRRRGHELVIVSASLTAYLDPLAGGQLGFDGVIGVELEVGADERLTGRLARPNVRGPEKAVRLQEWLGDAADVELWAYGNSSGDDALLAMADHPVRVGRRAGRRRRR